MKSAILAILFPFAAVAAALTPDTVKDDIPGTATISDIVTAGGSARPADVHRIVDGSFNGGTQEVNRVTGAFDGATNKVALLDAAKRDRNDYRAYRMRKDCWTWSAADGDTPTPEDFLATANLANRDPLIYDAGTGGWFGATQYWPNGKRKYLSGLPPGGATSTNLNFAFTAYAPDGVTETARFRARAVRQTATDETYVWWDNPYVRVVTTDELDIRIRTATNAIRRVDGTARTLPKYLWRYDSSDSCEKDAYWYYSQEDATFSISPGLCSSRRVGGILERNYDWYRDESAEFVVLMQAGPGRFASAGIANIGENLTEEFVTSGAPSRFYKCLPGRTVDGINSEGVAIEVNVVATNGSPWETHVEDDGRDIDSRWAVRFVLDNAASAGWAASNLASRVYIAKAMKARGYSVHYAIVDRESTWLVEDGKAIMRPASWPLVMTNFRLDTTPGRIMENDPYGAGYERYFMLTNGSVSITNAWYSNAYRRTAGGDFPWPTEFAGSVDAEGPIPNNATARLQAWAKANIPAAVPDTAFPRGAGLWQTVHTTLYNVTNMTLRVAVQETDDWYEFVVPVTAVAVVDDLSSHDSRKVLSANMGRELKESIDAIKSRGRYLSVWDSTTGLAKTAATTSPYAYRNGDYFIVGTVGATNYRPSGTEYTNGVPSRAVETDSEVKANDTYYFDGSSWSLLKTPKLDLDTTLTIEGKAADAKAVGDRLDEKLGLEGGEMSGDIGMGGHGLYGVGHIEAEGPIETTGDVIVRGSASFGGEVSVDLDLKTARDLYVEGDAIIDGDATVNGGLSAGSSTIGQVGLENGDVSYIYNGMYRNITDLHAAVGGKLDIEKTSGYWTGSKTYAKFDIVTKLNSSNFYVSLADGNAGHEPTASSTWWRSYTSLVDAAKFVNGSKIDAGIAEAKSYTDDATNGVDRTKLMSPDGNSYQTSDGGFYEKTGATPYYELFLSSSVMTYMFDKDTSDGIYYCENFEGGIRARLRFVGGYWSLDGFLNGFWDNIASTSGTGDDQTIVMAGGVFTFTRKVGPGGFSKTKQVAYTYDIPDFPINSLVLTNGVIKTTDGGSVSASAIGAAPQSTTYTKAETDAKLAGKANKAANPTSGNFASLTEDGDLADSGIAKTLVPSAEKQSEWDKKRSRTDLSLDEWVAGPDAPAGITGQPTWIEDLECWNWSWYTPGGVFESFRTWSETSPDDPGPIELYDELDIMSGRHFTSTRDRIAKESQLTSKADRTMISATDTTFSNAVMSVATGISTNDWAVIASVADWASVIPGGVPTGAGTLGAVLAALAAAVLALKKRTSLLKSDGTAEDDFATQLLGKPVANAKVRYALATTASAAMADRTVNIYTLSSGTVPMVFPTATTHDGKTYARDFLLKLTYSGGTLQMPQGVTKVGDDLSFEAGKTYLLAFTEVSANKFYVRSIDITEA